MTKRYWLLILYGIGLNAYLLGYFAFGMGIPVIAQTIHLAHWVLLSAWIAFPLYLYFLPRRIWALLLVFPMMMFIIWYGKDFIPPAKPSHAGDTRPLTLATFNIQGNSDGEMPALSSILGDLNADIVALEEVAYVDRVKLAREWKDEYPYQVFAIQSRFDMIGIMSRYPILETNIPSNRDFTRPKPDSARYVRAIIDFKGQPIAVYVFHPMRPNFIFFLRYDDYWNRLNIEQITSALETETYPTIVLCDCNASPLTPQYQLFRAKLSDLQAERGWGLGLTHTGLPWLPFRNTRIDYIWYSHEFIPLDVKVWPDNGTSDHFPLWGRLQLRAN